MDNSCDEFPVGSAGWRINSDGQITAYMVDGQWHDNADHRTLADIAERFPNKDLPFGNFPVMMVSGQRVQTTHDGHRYHLVDNGTMPSGVIWLDGGPSCSGQPLQKTTDARILDLICKG